ncbi:hypothetical protein EVAR_84682_1 [Eumeta japonica]|uniref:Cationic amino acid transporter n=1 Tax=Eumeta variegata TaxID=151549 RepID=A0A4C1ZY31_EUMVA|nr:hypothetical protein EVAR_84682_1 [Eumeta japonica]
MAALVQAYTCNNLELLTQVLPPAKTSKGRRERNLRSFADYMAMWMTFLSHLVAVAVCARVLSATADNVTGGRTRRWLFGYETRALGEPWPDVLGVTVVMVVCAMYMCGLEESMMFTFILLILLYVFSQFFAIFGLINLDIANIRIPPITVYEIFAAGAPISYAFTVKLPNKKIEKISKSHLLLIVLPMAVLATLCFLYANMLKGTTIDAALPVTTLLEARAAGWLCPVLAAVTVAGVCLALTELCPLLFNVLVTLASPEWKVLARSMTYESTTTGSPVLAVFTAGSLAAILAFACPLSHMITLMNASHLLGIAIKAFHFTIMRCVPTAEQREAGDVEYTRLNAEKKSTKTQKIGSNNKSGLWFIRSALRHTKTLESIKSKIITKDAEERECLLLDECNSSNTEIVIMSNSSANDNPGTEEISEAEGSDDASSGDDSTDIDAVVKEYRDRIQVVTATPEANIAAPPCLRGARLATCGASMQLLADALIAAAFYNSLVRETLLPIGIILWLFGTLISAIQPAHTIVRDSRCRLQGPITLLMAVLFLTPLLLDSWPAVLLFATAGMMIYARCERWCGALAVREARRVLRVRKLHVDSSAAPVATTHLAHIDTVYIPRIFKKMTAQKCDSQTQMTTKSTTRTEP